MMTLRLWKRIRLRLRSLFRHRQVEGELDEELRYHLERETEERGAAEALRRFNAGGNFDAVREACRDQRGLVWLENLVQDAHRALRRLARAPAFSLTAIAVLGLGIASATAMFSVCDAALLRPLPGIAGGGKLVHLERVEHGVLLGDMSYPDYEDFASQVHAFSGLSATSGVEANVAAAGFAEQVVGELVTGNYFSTLGVRAEIGRLIAASDETPGHNQVAVLSDAFWRSHFGGRPDVIGRTIGINQSAITVIGVAAPSFQGATLQSSSALWVPITAQPLLHPFPGWHCLTNRQCGWITAFGRLAPGVGLRQAQPEVTTVAARIAAAHPLEIGRTSRVVAGIGSWSDDRASMARYLTLLLSGALLLVAMAAASVGSLFLARMGARRREVATELALGAGSGRVAQQLLLEGVLIGAASALLGAAGASPLAAWLVRHDPTAPQNLAPALNGHLLVFASAAAVVCALLMSLAPAWLALRAEAMPALRQGGYLGGARHALQRWMLAGQVATALLLLLAAGLTVRTLEAATAGTVPADAGHVFMANLDTSFQGYSQPQAKALFHRLQAQIASQPGVRAVALAGCIPLSLCSRSSVFAAGTEPPAAIRARDEFIFPNRPNIDSVSPEFFGVLGMPVVAGRDFNASDVPGNRVCIINQTLARALWPGGSALGKRVSLPSDSSTGDFDDFTVVGIVADRRTESLLQPAQEQMYIPEAQTASAGIWLAVDTDMPTAKLQQMVRRDIAAIAPGVALAKARTLADQERRSLWQPLSIAVLSGFFGLLAALLAAIGLFGTVAQSVQERRRELGVRLALGATPRGLVAMVVGEGFSPIAWGLAAGGLAALGLERLLTPFLYGVTPTDSRTWLAAAALLSAVAIVGTWLAAHRAARIQPIEALRCE